MKVAIVHDWLANYGGAEKCIESFLNIFPDAPIYTTVYDPAKLPEHFQKRDIRTSFIQHLPGSPRRYRGYLPLMPLAFESFDLSGYDLVLSSSHACAKGVVTGPDTLHISYIHTPMRYAWDLYHRYLDLEKVSKWKRALIAPLMHYLRLWDRQSADRVDILSCNSHHVRRRIEKYYRRDAHVIYPPVNTQYYQPNGLPAEDFYLIVARQVPYKRVDLAITACNQLGVKLKVVGMGPEHERLRAIAGPTIEMLGRQPDAVVRELYQSCRAFIFSGEEDFGITAVEAQAAGRPVIAYAKGGALETVIDGQTGLFFDRETPDSLADAIKRLESREWDGEAIRHHAVGFDTVVYETQIRQLVESEWQSFGRKRRHQMPKVSQDAEPLRDMVR